MSQEGAVCGGKKKWSFGGTRLKQMWLERCPMEHPPIWNKSRLEFQVLKWGAMSLSCLSCTNNDLAQEGVARATPPVLGTQHKGRMQTVRTCKRLLLPRVMSKNMSSYCHTQGSAFSGPNDWNCGNFISFRCYKPKMAQDWEPSCSTNDKSLFTFNCKWSTANPT